MALRKTRWLMAALQCLVVWPGATHEQSSALMEAYNRYSELYAQGRLAIAALALVVLVGCSGITMEVLGERVVSPGTGSVAIAIYEVGDAGGYFRMYPVGSKNKRDFRRRLIEGLRRSKAFTEILDPPPALLPGPALVVSVKIGVKLTGGLFTRQSRDEYAIVELRDSKEVVLAKFEIWGEVSWRSLANKIATAIARWSRGEGLTGNPPTVYPFPQVERPEDLRVATNLNNLGSSYQTEGKYTEAESLYKRALAIREKALGPEHPSVARSLNNLAGLYRAQGRYAEAEPLYQRSLAILERILGPEHPHVAQSLNSLAAFYQAQRRYAEAEPLLKQALAILEKVLGPEHPNVATSLENYAAVLRETEGEDKAEELEARAKAIRAKAE